MDLPKLDELATGGGTATGSGATGKQGSTRQAPKLDDILPKQEHRMLNPNIQIYSEEQAKALEERQIRQ